MKSFEETVAPLPANDDSNSDDSDNCVASNEALLKSRITEYPRSRTHVSGSQLPSDEGDMGQIEGLSERKIDDISNVRKYMTVGVLFLINLLNYMDRFTIVGVLLDIQNFFDISNASAGLLQTVFIISYMVVAPIFGYLGDRFNRKLLIFGGMLVWSGCTLLASFITNPNHFLIFLALRGLVGIGEASYSTVAPTLIADLFVKSKRTRMLSVFFFAIPVGSGLGYIVGSGAAQAGGSWHWALRVTPGLGLVTMILLLVIIPNPERGASETATDRAEQQKIAIQKSSYWNDVKYIVKNKSFVFVTIAFTFMAFVVGSLTIWGPIFIAYSQVVVGALAPCVGSSCEYSSVTFIFGLVTCVAGFSGVLIGAESAKLWKDRGRPEADALICGIGLILAAPLLFAGFQMATTSLPVCWICIFFADTAMCLTWTLVGDMTMYVTMPSRRSTANAIQILTMHLFGDAGSPYLLGVMSDSLMASMPDTYYSKYLSLLRAMYVTLFSAVLSGCFFLIASLFLVSDKKKVDDCLAGKQTSPATSLTGSDTSDSTEMTPCSNGSAKEDDRLLTEELDGVPVELDAAGEDVPPTKRELGLMTNSRDDQPFGRPSPPYLSVKPSAQEPSIRDGSSGDVIPADVDFTDSHERLLCETSASDDFKPGVNLTLDVPESVI